MRKTLFNLFFFQLLAINSSLIAQDTKQRDYWYLDSLYRYHQYFELRRELNEKENRLSEKDNLILQAKILSVFNSKERSNELIDRIFKESSKLPDSTKKELLEIQSNNYFVLNNYREVLESVKKQLKLKVGSVKELQDLRNDSILYSSLIHVPKQSALIEESIIPLEKDKVGLYRIPVEFNGKLFPSIFDTGANISVISDSLARRLNFEIFGNEFRVLSITGKEVQARLAVAENIKLGKTILKNVVFMVFPEESLAIPQLNYKMEAIIGFPAIHALKEIQIIKDSLLIIPQKLTRNSQHNLTFDFLTPIVEIKLKDRSLPFILDTGASTTILDKDFYEHFSEEIDKNDTRDTLQLAGAGGLVKQPVYKILFEGKLGEEDFRLNDVPVYYIADFIEKKGILGNLGQDIFDQFNRLILNFEKMFLELD